MGVPPDRRSPVRLLVLAYYFPPSGGAGVQRVLKWVKYLPDYGVRSTVVTVREGAYPQLDLTLQAEVPSEVDVIRTRALDPFGIYARLTGRARDEAVAARTDDVGTEARWPEMVARWIRANVFVPDARVGWVPFAVARGLKVIRAVRPDVILTTGPPHSVHLAGRLLHGRTNVPWLADFRDPWTDIHYYGELPRTAVARSFDARLERAVLRSASAVSTVSASWGRLLAEKAGRTVDVIENGFDPADFGGPPPEPAEPFTVVHVGSLYASRNPVAFWRGLARLDDTARARIVGRVGEAVRASARDAGIASRVDWIPYLPHADAIGEMRRATVLLLSTEPHDRESGHVTGKLYEYLASGRPVLGLGDPHGDAAELLRATGAGRMFSRHDLEGVAAHLADLHARWQRRQPLTGATEEAAAPYSRWVQAGQLADLLRRIANVQAV